MCDVECEEEEEVEGGGGAGCNDESKNPALECGEKEGHTKLKVHDGISDLLTN